MIGDLFRRLRHASSKPPMIGYLALLLVLGAWATKNVSLIGRGLVMVAIYTILDLAAGRMREGKWILPSSAWISGLILSLVLVPTASWTIVLLAPVIAIISKHLVRVRRKHLFNPAATALVVLGFLFPTAGIVSWWGASWGIVPLVVIMLSGLVTIVRVKRWKTALAFLLVYLGGASLLLLTRGGAVLDLRTLVLDGTLLFFATVMLIEPVTTAYQPAWLRTAFGMTVGVLTLLLSLPGQTLPLPDPLLASLLIGNLGATTLGAFLRRG